MDCANVALILHVFLGPCGSLSGLSATDLCHAARRDARCRIYHVKQHPDCITIGALRRAVAVVEFKNMQVADHDDRVAARSTVMSGGSPIVEPPKPT